MVVINNLHKDLHISCLLLHTHPHASSPDFFFYSLLAFFFPGSDQLTNPFAGEFIYILILGYFSMKSTHWEDFLLLLFFKAPLHVQIMSILGGLTDLLTKWSTNQDLAVVVFL